MIILDCNSALAGLKGIDGGHKWQWTIRDDVASVIRTRKQQLLTLT